MKCKICGHRSNTLKANNEHRRKKHPDAMKRKKSTRKTAISSNTENAKYCPNCGKKL